MSDKLILEYDMNGEKHSFPLPCCPYHSFNKCGKSGRKCLYPCDLPPNNCHVIGKQVLNGTIRRAT